MKTMKRIDVSENKKAQIEYMNKQLIYSKDMMHELQNSRTMKRIDKYNHEAGCSGCIITDYDKYRRQNRINAMLIVAAIELYFLAGLIIGLVIMYAG
jgi:hypothetical protein